MMIREVILPQLGETMDAGTIARWHKREGERVEKGEPLVAVETDKATIDVDAQQSGFLTKIVVPEGETVPVMKVLGYIADRADETPEAATGNGSARAQAAVAGLTIAVGIAEPASPAEEGPPMRVSPAAKRIAREYGIDATQLKGTGPSGRVVEADVRRAILAREEAAKAPAMPSIAPTPSPEPKVVTTTGPGVAVPPGVPAATPSVPRDGDAAKWDVVPLNRIRRIIGERLTRTHLEAVHVTLHGEVDMAEASKLRTQLNREWEPKLGVKVTFTDVVAKACAKALRDNRELNASLGTDGVHLHRHVNLGVAMAVQAGLVVPVIRDADAMPLLGIAKTIRQLTERARAGQLLPDDFAGGTFTLTNMGMMGIDHFTPIINGAECAILGVGRIVDRPVAVDGTVGVRPMMTVSLSFDHRIVDGAPAAAYLARVREILENPYLILV